MADRPLRVGDVVHGFAQGTFGRDDYDCKRVEMIAADWVVLRTLGHKGEPRLYAGDPDDLVRYTGAQAGDYCHHFESPED